MARSKSSAKKRTKISSTRKRFVLKPHFRLFLPWPAVFFIILVTGVLLAGWTFQAGASEIAVTGRVPAAPLLGSAVITNVTNGSRFSEIPMHLIGTCPLNSYVSIYTNDFFRGSVLCSGSGGFTINVDLFLGQNSLSARAYNITDDEGPRSGSIEVFYDAPTSASPEIQNTAALVPLTLTTKYEHKGAIVGQIIDLTFEVNGGSPPYALSIDWGDGEQDIVSQKEAGELMVNHVYKKSGKGKKRDYTISILATDTEKTKAYLQLFIIVNPSTLGSLVATTIPTRPSVLNNRGVAMWTVYGIVTLMAISFYLGEREELIILRRPKLRRR